MEEESADLSYYAEQTGKRLEFSLGNSKADPITIVYDAGGNHKGINPDDLKKAVADPLQNDISEEQYRYTTRLYDKAFAPDKTAAYLREKSGMDEFDLVYINGKSVNQLVQEKIDEVRKTDPDLAARLSTETDNAQYKKAMVVSAGLRGVNDIVYGKLTYDAGSQKIAVTAIPVGRDMDQKSKLPEPANAGWFHKTNEEKFAQARKHEAKALTDSGLLEAIRKSTEKANSSLKQNLEAAGREEIKPERIRINLLGDAGKKDRKTGRQAVPEEKQMKDGRKKAVFSDISKAESSGKEHPVRKSK